MTHLLPIAGILIGLGLPFGETRYWWEPVALIAGLAVLLFGVVHRR